MAGKYVPTDDERKIIADMAARRKAAKRSSPLSGSFVDRMASSIVDPKAAPEVQETEDDRNPGVLVFRP